MKTIIFSDTHLTSRFDKRRFAFLKKIISKADRVIINGDFWDDSTKNKKFMRSRWSELFPLLKKKETIYIYGNHDAKKKWSEDVSEFCDEQGFEYTFTSGRKEFIVTHGNRLTPTITEKYFLKQYSNPAVRLFWKIAFYASRHMHKTMLRLNLERIPIFFTKGGFYKRFRYVNEKMKIFSRKLDKNQYLICGHSHSQELDLESHYINDGFINHRMGQYVEIEGGRIKMIEEKF